HWYPLRASHAEHELIALLQAFNRQPQAAELIFEIWISASNITNQFRRELAQAGAERIVEPGKIVIVGDAIGQVHVNRRRWFVRGIVVLLMQRNREHITRMRPSHQRLAPEDGRPARRQRLASSSRSG